MADKLDWLNKHFVAVRYTDLPDLVAKENYKIRPDLEPFFTGGGNAETIVYALAEAGKWKDACELMAYMVHRRAGIWWGYRSVLSLMEEIMLNPAGERDIASIGADIEKGPEVPEFAKIELPKPDPAALAKVDALLAEAKAQSEKAKAMLDPGMLHYVEEAVEVAFQEFKRVQGIHPIDLLKQIGAKLTEPRYQVDPKSPIILETAKLKAQLAAVQRDTVATIKSVLPPKIPSYQKKLSDNALAAAYRWVAAPNAENAQRCLNVGNECSDQPGGLLSLSAFWSFGNLMPEGEQVVQTPPGLAANGLTQTLLLCALAPGGVRKVTERYAEYFRLGVEVLSGADNWEATLGKKNMPHEQIPNPDWSKAQDKSATEWQAEVKIADLDAAEKEKVITHMIAEAREGRFPAPGGKGGSAYTGPLPRVAPSGNGTPSGGKPPDRTLPPEYKRWKP
jgi:hypothetical protein